MQMRMIRNIIYNEDTTNLIQVNCLSEILENTTQIHFQYPAQSSFKYELKIMSFALDGKAMAKASLR